MIHKIHELNEHDDGTADVVCWCGWNENGHASKDFALAALIGHIRLASTRPLPQR